MKLFLLFVNGAGLYGGNGEGMGTEHDLQQGDSLPFGLPKSQVLTREIIWSLVLLPRDQYLASFLK